MSLVSLSDLLAGARPDKHCVAIREGQRITLAQLRSDVSHNADRLSTRAIRRAAVICDDGYWFIVGLLSLLKIGADVILPPNAQTGTLLSVATETDGLLTDSEAINNAKVIVLESGRSEVAPFKADFERGGIDFYTSGSTGEIKKVEKSLTQFEREASVLEQMWGTELGEIPTIGTVTHQHVFGMTFRIMWPLVGGRPFYPGFHVVWEPLMAQLNGPAMIVTSPAQLTRLGGLTLEATAKRPRMIVSAGAALPAEAAKETTEIFGCVPTEILGSTEAGVIAWRRGGPGPVLWQPLPSVEVAASPNGVLTLRSPHASGHAWCEQADRISLTGDGRFRLEGRIDRILKVEGKRVSLERLERQIAGLPWVNEAAVVGLGGSRTYLGAVVKLSAAGVAEIERLGKFRFERMLRRELSSTEDLAVLPRRWRFVDFMPMDGLGKRRVRDVLELLEQMV